MIERKTPKNQKKHAMESAKRFYRGRLKYLFFKKAPAGKDN
jgi:hypothetical protein